MNKMKTDPVITKTKFRLMIVFSLICAVIWGIFDAYDETSIAIHEALYQEYEIWEAIISVILLIGLLTAFIGLFLLKEWARKLYVYGFFPLLLMYLLPTFSWVFMSGIGAIFYDLSNILATLIWGILVVPSLYQPLFQKNPD